MQDRDVVVLYGPLGFLVLAQILDTTAPTCKIVNDTDFRGDDIKVMRTKYISRE